MKTDARAKKENDVIKCIYETKNLDANIKESSDCIKKIDELMVVTSDAKQLEGLKLVKFKLEGQVKGNTLKNRAKKAIDEYISETKVEINQPIKDEVPRTFFNYGGKLFLWAIVGYIIFTFIDRVTSPEYDEVRAAFIKKMQEKVMKFINRKK
jgi:hypothetical protein